MALYSIGDLARRTGLTVNGRDARYRLCWRGVETEGPPYGRRDP
jgi:hypothetical protein